VSAGAKLPATGSVQQPDNVGDLQHRGKVAVQPLARHAGCPARARTGHSMQSAKIQTRGRLTLPAEVREALKVEPGDQVTFTETKPGRFEVRAQDRSGALLERRPVNRLAVKVPSTKRQMELPI
jgi:AbrB family looped-hinge helix DNA binding protein